MSQARVQPTVTLEPIPDQLILPHILYLLCATDININAEP